MKWGGDILENRRVRWVDQATKELLYQVLFCAH